MRRACAISFGLVLAAQCGLAKVKSIEVRFGQNLSIDKSLSDFTVVQGTGYRAQLEFVNPGQGQFRLVFDKIVAGHGGPFSLKVVTIARSYEIPAEVLTAHDTFESDVYTGKSITVEVSAAAAPIGLNFRVAELVYATQPGRVLSITGDEDDRDDVLSLEPSDPMRIHSKAVARIIFKKKYDGNDYNCTGFLIGSDILLTNNHCLGSGTPDIDENNYPDDPAYRCATAVMVFGYLSPSSLSDDSEVEQVHCKKVVKFEYQHDYAVVQLERSVDARWGILKIATATPPSGTALYMPQYPGNYPQKISIKHCTMFKPKVQGFIADVDFSHLCDTENGSSGAPIIDVETNEVVGLHHLPFTSDFPHLNRAVRAEALSLILSGTGIQ